MTIAGKTIKFIIRAYQLLLSPMLGVNCRFHPNCSSYAVEAINIHGAVKGVILGGKRFFRCHPFSKKTGYDPVPDNVKN